MPQVGGILVQTAFPTRRDECALARPYNHVARMGHGRYYVVRAARRHGNVNAGG